ncbi:hypothetical protein OEA41_005506 [Lepraria neglecta]|uniref:tRNA(Phe) 7-[(3-amino-3-carboxypropyl)-4-demethylwyosine(37)-N(4)]-methyltransferase n=1 Tax=Lepraria neglecta TaxID=209136 RepID=A0AAD9Z3W4_9LECA|nr:hypothetical protein OEA41_005506 [Lepraria neglecta]
MGPSPPIPPSFIAKKNAILTSLSVPDDAYTDLSPKGTVDEALKPLIDRINALEGIVTTSSCSGRVSVFLEGSKGGNRKGKIDDPETGTCENAEGQAAVPGGKGMGGRWLFVSHEPVHFNQEGSYLATRLGMSYQLELYDYQKDMDINQVRLARFQFEPMILHVTTASLHHAQPILAAAINAGFRESGIQSLKNLDDAKAFPMVAIRSSGLALESIVGSMRDCMEDLGSLSEDNGGYSNDEEVHSLVREDYLDLLIKLANERFKTNTERMRRFEEDLFRREGGSALGSPWEDGKDRQERKRAEGLKQQEELRRKKVDGKRGV